jgi:hypothetical protein
MSYSHDSGTTTETITVPAGKYVLKYSCKAGGSGATLTITPSGGVAQPAITIPANGSFGDEFSDAAGVKGGLGPGSTLAFVDTVTFVVRYV